MKVVRRPAGPARRRSGWIQPARSLPFPTPGCRCASYDGRIIRSSDMGQKLKQIFHNWQRTPAASIVSRMSSYRGRRAATIENDAVRVTVLEEGGHIAEIADQ